MKRIVSVGLLLVMMVSVAGCGVKKYGELYSLQEAYDNGYITQEDLLSIAYYRDGRKNNEELIGEDFVPIPKDPENLDDTTKDKIISDIAKAEHKKKKNIEFGGYMGTYNGYIVISRALSGVFPAVIVEENVGGVCLMRDYRYQFIVWKESK